MNKKSSFWITLAVLAYTTWNATGLVQAWQTAPLEKFSWIMLLVWTIPIVLTWCTFHSEKDREKLYTPFFLWSAIVLTFLGVITSLNALKYVGFACALACFVPKHWSSIPWLISSISWMPAMGWIGSRYFPNYQLEVRIAIVFLGVISWITIEKNHFSHEEST